MDPIEYINHRTITTNDLNVLDDQINGVQLLLEKRQEAVQWKLDKSNTFEDSQTTAIVGEIILEVSKVSSAGVEEALDILARLRQKYGDLQVIKDLTRLYDLKQQATNDDKYLSDCNSVEEEVNDLDVNSGNTDKFIDVYHQIQRLQESPQPPNGVSEELIQNATLVLNKAFNEKVDQVKNILITDLSSLLKRSNWLGSKFKLETLSPETASEINVKVSSLISLQNISNKPQYPDTWWALDVLLEPFYQRFDYHFNTNKETNKLSKPEWAFNYVEEFLTKNLKLFQVVINQSFKPLKKIMIYEVITSLLVPTRKKILDMVNILNERIESYKTENDTVNYDKSGRLLSHLIFELTSFDQRLRNNYKYNPHLKSIDELPAKRWLGLTADVLLQGDKERLGTSNWLNFESILANKRFTSEIIQDQDALKIDIDYRASDKSQVVNGISKPSYSSLNLIKLFNNLTSHYKTMRMVKFQLKYVSTIQLKLIESYHDYLRQNLKKFDDKNSLVKMLNLIPGSLDTKTKPNQDQKATDTIKDLEMLTGIFCLAQFILQNLEQWSEELVFIQLWNAYKAVANKQYEPEATIFTGAIDQYSQLIGDIRSRYESFFKKGIRNYLKEYINSSQWDIQEIRDSSSQFASLVTNLPTYLDYINRCILPTDYYIIANNIVSALCSLWYEYIITNNTFTKTGAQQLDNDFSFIITQLKQELLIEGTEEDEVSINTASNFEYLKVIQSIELFKKYSSVLAKTHLKSFQPERIRSDFPHKLSNLRPEEIREVLYRVL